MRFGKLTSVMLTVTSISVVGTIALGLLLVARITDIENLNNRYKNLGYSLAARIHRRLMNDPGYRFYDPVERANEIRPVVNYVLEAVLHQVQEDHRSDVVKHVNEKLIQICSKE